MRILQVVNMGSGARSWALRASPNLSSADPRTWATEIARLGIAPVSLPPADAAAPAIDLLFIDVIENRLSWMHAIGADMADAATPAQCLGRVLSAINPDLVVLEPELSALAVGDTGPMNAEFAVMVPGTPMPALPAGVARQVMIGHRANDQSEASCISVPVTADRSALVSVAPDQARAVDVMCAATLGPASAGAIDMLCAVAKAPLGLRGEFEIAYRIDTADREALPVGLTMHDRGPAFGRDLAEAAASAKIAIDFADGRTNLARLNTLAILASADVTIVAEDGPLVRSLLTPGRDAITFTSQQNLIDAIYWLLANPAERSAMAQRAQDRIPANPGMESLWFSKLASGRE